jgi:hypothetical protein
MVHSVNATSQKLVFRPLCTMLTRRCRHTTSRLAAVWIMLNRLLSFFCGCFWRFISDAVRCCSPASQTILFYILENAQRRLVAVPCDISPLYVFLYVCSKLLQYRPCPLFRWLFCIFLVVMLPTTDLGFGHTPLKPNELLFI